MDLATVLQNAQHPSLEIRSQAEAYLNQAVEAQYGQFLLALCIEFATEGKPESGRQLAGLYIKNLISAQDNTIYERKVEKWLQCDQPTKEQIRAGFIEAVKSPVKVVSHTGAQVLAAYGAVDVPRNQWPTLLPTLFQNINLPDVPESCKIASLEALGYMCDTMVPEGVDVSVVNQMLSSIIDGMRADRSNEIRLAAVVALNNSLDFTRTNFQNPVERDAIMRAICEATQCPATPVREKAFECLVTVGDLYYEHLKPYVDTLFQLSVNAIKTDEQIVGLQAVEFWSTIADSEFNILADEEDANSGVLLNIIEQASPSLVPLMLENMTKQQEDADDDDSWNISMAAAACLEAIARTICDKIVDFVLPFVTQNINNTNWRLKEAAVMAFGMILDGPSDDKLSPLVMQAMPILINCLKDQNTLVRETSAWTIGRICHLHKSSLSADILPPMVAGLATALEDNAPKVVAQACYAVHNLAEACADESEATTNVLSHFMPMMLQKLLVVTNREDWNSENIRSSAYEAINMMVENSATDMHQIVLQLLSEAVNRLEQTFSPQVNSQDRGNLQGCFCSLIGEIVKKLDVTEVLPVADKIMQLLFQVLSSKGGSAQEDAFMTVGRLAEKLETQFLRYLPFLQAPLIAGLKNIEEYQVCATAVGVVSDLTRAVGNNIAPMCDDIMRCLLELLQSQTLNRTVKPLVISLFADIALAIEGEFERYAAIVLGILKQAGQVSFDGDDEDLVDYINSLREAILEAYTGILQGLSSAKKQDMVIPAIDTIIDFLRSASDEHRSEEVLKAAIGLLGDLGQTFGNKMLPVYNQPYVNLLLQQGSQIEEISEVANWTQNIVMSVRSGRMSGV